MDFPSLRVRDANTAPIRPDGAFVLYWMTANRRTRYNFALERAASRAAELGKPLVVLEALRCGYRWASDRMHAFVLQGMAVNAERLTGSGVVYHPYVEPEEGAGRGLVEALARRACLVVGDDWPAFFHPRMTAAAAARLPVRLELVDANGLLPMRASDKVFARAVDFRRHLQRTLAPHLEQLPRASALGRRRLAPLAAIPRDIARRWPMASAALLETRPAALAKLPIDHEVPPAPLHGGESAGRRVLKEFIGGKLARYPERNHPDTDTASGLSPWLHFGHVGAHEVFSAVAKRESWAPGKLGAERRGARHGWWGMSEAAEAFLDELVTWRELGFNFCSQRDDYDRYTSLPEWARATLEEHRSDPREALYTRKRLEAAETGDELWNAAQRQLREEGRIHNYLRMLWGKNVLGWTRSPRKALEILLELNNRWALDGRDPNSYSGIFWCLGRYDRAWGPERPVFGKIRYMTSENTRRKLKLAGWLARWSED